MRSCTSSKACWPCCLLIVAMACGGAEAKPEERTESTENPIVDLYRTGKLLGKKDFERVRQAFSKLFESQQEQSIRAAWGGGGADYDAMKAWLDERPAIKENLFTAITEQDDVVEALRIFNELRKQFEDELEKFPELGIALSVVWDRPDSLFNYDQFQEHCHARSVGSFLDGFANFRYLVENEQIVPGLKHLPREFLVHLIDHKTPLTERAWAIKNYATKRQDFGTCYQDVPYDYDLYNNGTPRLSGHNYDLPSIRKYGGVCAMQADFAARVGKSVGIPSMYTSGENKTGGRHAWVMWCEIKGAANNKVSFQFKSHGRYNMDMYYTGDIRHPQTGVDILDRDLEIELGAAGIDTQAKRHADLLARALPMIEQNTELAIKDRLRYIEESLAICPYHPAPWVALAQMARSGKIEKSQTKLITSLLNRLFSTFSNYPDMSWRVFVDLASVIPADKQRFKFFAKANDVYLRAGRPDLSCQASLAYADYLTAAEEWQKAADLLANTAMSFPDEGRYAPSLIEKLTTVAENLENGPALVARFYLAFLPKVPTHRLDRPSEYCIQVHEMAIQYLTNKGMAEAAEKIKISLAKVKA